MRSHNAQRTALLLTACILLSCGSQRQCSLAQSHEQSQHRSERAVSREAQHLRDTTLEEWELLLLDMLTPSTPLERPPLASQASDSTAIVSTQQPPRVRYLRARRLAVKERDSVAQQRHVLESDTQQLSRQQETKLTERQPTRHRSYGLVGLLVGLAAGIVVAVLLSKIRLAKLIQSLARRLKLIVSKYIVLR